MVWCVSAEAAALRPERGSLSAARDCAERKAVACPFPPPPRPRVERERERDSGPGVGVSARPSLFALPLSSPFLTCSQSDVTTVPAKAGAAASRDDAAAAAAAPASRLRREVTDNRSASSAAEDGAAARTAMARAEGRGGAVGERVRLFFWVCER